MKVIVDLEIPFCGQKLMAEIEVEPDEIESMRRLLVEKIHENFNQVVRWPKDVHSPRTRNVGIRS